MHPQFLSIFFLVPAPLIKGILKDLHSYLRARGLPLGPFQWSSCFPAPLAQDHGCESVFLICLVPSSPSSPSHNLLIKSFLSFTVCLPLVVVFHEVTHQGGGHFFFLFSFFNQHAVNLFYNLGHVTPSLRFLSGEFHPGWLVCTGVTGSLQLMQFFLRHHCRLSCQVLMGQGDPSLQPLLQAKLCPLSPVHSGLSWGHQERLAADKVGLPHRLLSSLRHLRLLSCFRLQGLGARLVLLVGWLLWGPSPLLPSDGDPGWPRLALSSRPRC